MPSLLPRIVASLARQAIEAFDLASELGHPGEAGRAREQVIRRFFEQIVPPDFGIDTGFVIDAAGGISRQVDIVIFRKQRAPVLEIGGVKHFMVESVAAVIETKAAIRSRSVLIDALENIKSVKQLDRTNNGENRIAGTPVAVQPMIVQHQVWGAVVAGRSLKYLTTLDALISWIECQPRTLWPNAYLDLHEYFIEYAAVIDNVPTRTSTDPMSAVGLAGCGPWNHPWGLEPTLAFLGVDLLDFLRVTPLIDFKRSGYFTTTRLPMEKWFEFPEGFAPAASMNGETTGGSEA